MKEYMDNLEARPKEKVLYKKNEEELKEITRGALLNFMNF